MVALPTGRYIINIIMVCPISPVVNPNVRVFPKKDVPFYMVFSLFPALKIFGEKAVISVSGPVVYA